MFSMITYLLDYPCYMIPRNIPFTIKIECFVHLKVSSLPMHTHVYIHAYLTHIPFLHVEGKGNVLTPGTISPLASSKLLLGRPEITTTEIRYVYVGL